MIGAGKSTDAIPKEPRPLAPGPPYLWPESRALSRVSEYSTDPVFDRSIDDAKTVFGVVHNVVADGLEWLESKLAANPELHFCLLLVIYPACRTRREDLQDLLRICDLYVSRVQIRLYPIQRAEERPSSNLCIVTSGGSASMVVSPTGNFCIGSQSDDLLHLCIPLDTALHQQFIAWFDFKWTSAPALNDAAVLMPNLVPASGEEEADRLWNAFVKSLSEGTQDDDGVQVNVDAETGEVAVTCADGEPVTSVLDEWEVPRPNVAIVQVGKILHQGSLATIDNSSRVPPLDCPISAELFGIDSDHRTGTVSRKTRFSVSAIDEKTLKKLESYRKRTRELLNKMSYPLADGARWVPHSARSLLEQELDRVNKEGQELLGQTIGDEVEAFVESKRKTVAKDAQAEYAELHPKQKMPEDTLERILAELTNRLVRATNGKLLPKLSFLDVRIATAPDSDWSSQASQAFRFLRAVAKYPRECLSDAYFMRGLRVTQRSILPAMDVVGDHLVDLFIEKKSGIDDARLELGLIEQIDQSKADDLDRCMALYRLIKGDDGEAILTSLKNPTSTSSSVDSHQRETPPEQSGLFSN